MHESVMAWIKTHVEVGQLAMCSVLEVGSADVNGSVRQFFHGPYLGIDLAPGPGVDLVVPGGPIPLPDHSFEVIVSTEMLEHDPRPWLTLKEMARLLQHCGALFLTCRGYDRRGCFQVHNEPDRWRFSEDAMRIMAEDAGFDVISVDPDPQCPGWFLIASTA